MSRFHYLSLALTLSLGACGADTTPSTPSEVEPTLSPEASLPLATPSTTTNATNSPSQQTAKDLSPTDSSTPTVQQLSPSRTASSPTNPSPTNSSPDGSATPSNYPSTSPTQSSHGDTQVYSPTESPSFSPPQDTYSTQTIVPTLSQGQSTQPTTYGEDTISIPSPTTSDMPSPTVSPGQVTATAPRTETQVTTPTETVPISRPIVQTLSGSVQGIQHDFNTLAYLGIPYAKAPLKDLRWRGPQSIDPWTKTFDASEFGPICSQLDSADLDGDGENETFVVGEEDCLTLNIWQPPGQQETDNKPIVFYIHGGAFNSGSSSNDLREGADLAVEADAIVVTMEYRIGPFGWLRHSALQGSEQDENSGNFGLLDVIEALKWTRLNASAFGGDPDKITLMGTSAGAYITWALHLSPLSAGLFDRSIIMSGLPRGSSTEKAELYSSQWLNALLIADGLATEENVDDFVNDQSDEWIADYLREKSPEQLHEEALNNGGYAVSDFNLIKDDYVYPIEPEAVVAAGNYQKRPMIVGSNKDESKFFYFSLWNMSEITYQALMRSLYGDEIDAIEALYPRSNYEPASPYNQFVDIQDQLLELMGGVYVPWLAASHQDLWVFRYDFDELTPPLDNIWGAAHGFQLPLIMGNYDSDIVDASSLESYYQLIEDVQGLASCFINGKEPDECNEALEWPRFTASGTGSQQRLIWDTPLRVEAIPEIDRERIAYWLEYDASELPPMSSP